MSAEAATDTSVDEPTSPIRAWLEDPSLSLNSLRPGQRYTLVITLLLAFGLLRFGLPDVGVMTAPAPRSFPSLTTVPARDDATTVIQTPTTLPSILQAPPTITTSSSSSTTTIPATTTTTPPTTTTTTPPLVTLPVVPGP